MDKNCLTSQENHVPFLSAFFPSLKEALGAWVCTVMPRQCLLRGWYVLAQAYDNYDLGKETSGAQSE